MYVADSWVPDFVSVVMQEVLLGIMMMIIFCNSTVTNFGGPSTSVCTHDEVSQEIMFLIWEKGIVVNSMCKFLLYFLGSVAELEGQLITPEVTSSPHNLTSVPQPQNDNNTSASNFGSSTIATSPAPVPHNNGNSATPSSSRSSKKRKSGVDELIVASLNNIQERREKQVKKKIDEEGHFGQQVAATSQPDRKLLLSFK